MRKLDRNTLIFKHEHVLIIIKRKNVNKYGLRVGFGLWLL